MSKPTEENPLREVVFSVRYPGKKIDKKVCEELIGSISKLESLDALFGGPMIEDSSGKAAKSAAIYVSNNSLSVHQFTQYSWTLFRKCIQDVVNVLRDITGIEAVAPSIRYVNVIRYADSDKDISKYLNVFPSVNGELKDMRLDQFRLMVQERIKSPKGTSMIDVSPGKEGILFEVGFKSEKIEIQDMEFWYGAAHEVIKESFAKGVVSRVCSGE